MPISSYGLVHFSLLILLLSVSSPAASPVPSNEQTYYTHNRTDPLSFFKTYHGGYNITNSHYWASAVFTGVHGYGTAGIWIVGGLGFGIYLVIKNLCCYSSPSLPIAVRRHSSTYYFVPFLVIVICTFLVIVASSFVLAANHNSLVKTKKLEHTVLRVAKVAHRTIRIVTIAMKEMCLLLNPYNKSASVLLRSTSAKLVKESQMLRQVVDGHVHLLDRYIKIWYGATAGIVSVNLVLVVAALVAVLLHWQPGFLMIIALCWMITALCWILTGFHFFLHTFAEDTCFAFEEFQQNPGNNSLSQVLPCVDEVHADKIMIEIGSTVYKFIDKLNSKLSNLSDILGLDEEQEKSLSGIFKICNPFSDPPDYNYNPDDCPKNAIPISEIPNVLGRFTCYDDSSNVSCEVDKNFISKGAYNMALAYTQTIQELLDVLPDIESLARCTFVKDIFSDVVSEQCRPFRNSFKLLWLSMLSLSTMMVIIEFAWLANKYIKTKEEIFTGVM